MVWMKCGEEGNKKTVKHFDVLTDEVLEFTTTDL